MPRVGKIEMPLTLSHTRRLPARLKRLLKRRQAIEPIIGHMKSDGLLARNWLKGALGDALHAVMCGAGQNLRMILAYLRVLLAAFVHMLAKLLGPQVLNDQPLAHR